MIGSGAWVLVVRSQDKINQPSSHNSILHAFENDIGTHMLGRIGLGDIYGRRGLGSGNKRRLLRHPSPDLCLRT